MTFHCIPPNASSRVRGAAEESPIGAQVGVTPAAEAPQSHLHTHPADMVRRADSIFVQIFGLRFFIKGTPGGLGGVWVLEDRCVCIGGGSLGVGGSPEPFPRGKDQHGESRHLFQRRRSLHHSCPAKPRPECAWGVSLKAQGPPAWQGRGYSGCIYKCRLHTCQASLVSFTFYSGKLKTIHKHINSLDTVECSGRGTGRSFSSRRKQDVLGEAPHHPSPARKPLVVALGYAGMDSA